MSLEIQSIAVGLSGNRLKGEDVFRHIGRTKRYEKLKATEK